MIKEFLSNEEGFLSSNYTRTLKKYYTQEMAELLFVMHGLSIKAKLVLDIARWAEAENNTTQEFYKGFLERRPEYSNLILRGDVRHVTVLHEMRHHTSITELATQGLFGREMAARVFDFSVKGDSRLPEGVFPNSDRYSYEFSGVHPYESVSWWKNSPNSKHAHAFMRYGTAATLRRFFHETTVSGYNSPEILESIYLSMDVSREHERNVPPDAVAQEGPNT